MSLLDSFPSVPDGVYSPVVCKVLTLLREYRTQAVQYGKVLEDTYSHPKRPAALEHLMRLERRLILAINDLDRWGVVKEMAVEPPYDATETG